MLDPNVTEDNNQVLKLRDQLIPIIDLCSTFKINEKAKKENEGIIIVCQSGNRIAGLLADEIITYKQVVVKPIPDYIGVKENVSGCYIMETGDVGFIVDINSLLLSELGSGSLGNIKGDRKMHDHYNRRINDNEMYQDFYDDDENNNEDKYLVFNVNKEPYALDIKSIARIIEMQKITEMPDMPNYVKGVINLRGSIIPVIDLSLRFSLEGHKYLKRSCIVIIDIDNTHLGFIVDSVADVKNIDKKSIEPPPNFKGDSLKKYYISGLAKVEDEVLIIIDAKKLIHEKDLKVFQEMV